MTAEPIARVVVDLRAARVRHAVPDPQLNELALKRATTATVVDATAIYTALVAKDDPIWVYEDHPNIAPPWESAAVCYVNEHGNVIVMQVTATDVPRPQRRKRWEPGSPVDWGDVRWLLETFVWIGGRSPEVGSIPTTGPVHMWRFAVTESGEPADLSWIHLKPQYPIAHWDMAHLVLLGSLNFMACRNVRLVEPERPRPERRRLARTGVKVHTINVTSAGKSYRGVGASDAAGVPLTSVRGHFAEYGINGKGLLFGRFAGRFWIPQHARGSKDLGETEKDYRLTPR